MLGRPQVTATRVVFRNPWMALREDTLVWPDGTPGSYAVIEKPPGAVVVAVQDDHVWLVEQFRHTIERRCWELPQGALDGAGDVTAELIARTELEEETGVRAERLERLGRLFYAYGFSSQPFEAWRATGLSRGAPRPGATEQGLVAEAVPVASLPTMVAEERIVDAATVATLALAGLLR